MVVCRPSHPNDKAYAAGVPAVGDSKAHLIQALPVGDYTLVELAAPQGYKVADPVKFTVTETATIQEVVMVDEVAPALPSRTANKEGTNPSYKH